MLSTKELLHALEPTEARRINELGRELMDKMRQRLDFAGRLQEAAQWIRDGAPGRALEIIEAVSQDLRREV